MKLDDLTQKVLEFRDKRNWKQFHNYKDVAIAIALEANELLEHFIWKNGKDLEKYVSQPKNKKALGEELSDVLYNTLLLANELKIDLTSAFMAKLRKNEKKYPIRKVKKFAKSSKYVKYTQL